MTGKFLFIGGIFQISPIRRTVFQTFLLFTHCQEQWVRKVSKGKRFFKLFFIWKKSFNRSKPTCRWTATTVNCPAQSGLVPKNEVLFKRFLQHPKLKNFEVFVTAPNLQIWRSRGKVTAVSRLRDYAKSNSNKNREGKNPRVGESEVLSAHHICTESFKRRTVFQTFLYLKEKFQKKQTNVPLDRYDRQLSRTKIICFHKCGTPEKTLATPKIKKFEALIAAPNLQIWRSRGKATAVSRLRDYAKIQFKQK